MTITEKIDLVLKNQAKHDVRLENVNEKLSEVRSTVYGNGKRGLKEDSALMEQDIKQLRQEQKECPGRSINSTENKKMKLSKLGIIVAAISAVISACIAYLK